MNIYVITSKDNLHRIQEKLAPKYKTLNIQGTNDILEGIETVARKHIIEEYDLFLIISQQFIEDDLNSQRKISEMLNKACIYALKNLPIYFIYNDKNKTYQQDIESILTGQNVRTMPYKSLNMGVIEKVMKEVLVLTGTVHKKNTNVHRHIAEEKKRKQNQQFESHIDRIHSKRMEQDDEDFASLSRVKDILDQYTTAATFTSKVEEEDASSKILADIRTRIFADPTPLDLGLGDKLNIKTLNHTSLSDKISPQKLKENLKESNQDYSDYSNYMSTLEEVIKQVKESDDPNKHEMVLALIKDKSVANNQMYTIFSEFITEITKSSIEHVTAEYTKEINELHQFGEYKDVDQLIGDKLISIEELKATRGKMKDSVGYMIRQLTETTNLVNKELANVGKEYIAETRQIEKELIDYANDNNITTTDLTVPKKNEVMINLQEGYKIIKTDIQTLISTAQTTITNLMEIVVVDEKIIDKQDEVIDVLMTQKTKKILTVENLLQTKLSAIVGPDGAGKTHTAINMAKTESKIHKTLLVDLNIYNPNLIYYNNTKEVTSESRWLNSQTIFLEEFIHIPLGSHMHEQLPYSNNLTIIQPQDIIDLNEYESTVNPRVFAMHIQMFLEQLAQFYDKIIIILPYNLEQFGDIMDYVGTLYLVNDFEPNNLKLTIKLKDKHQDQFRKVPIKHFIINKTGRGTKLSIKEFLVLNEIDTRDYRYFPITWLQETLQFKIEGKIPVEHNINIRKIFDELIKR